MSLSTATILFALISSVSTTGYLQLEITSSNDCLVKLDSGLNSQIISLKTGEESIVILRPSTGLQTLKVIFSVSGAGSSQEKAFNLEVNGNEKRDLLDFDETVILIQSTFNCDKEFRGSRCQTLKRKFTSSTAPVRSTTSISKATTEVSTSTVSSASKSIELKSISVNERFSDVHILLITVAFVISALFILTVVFCCLLRLRNNSSIDPLDSSKSLKFQEDSSSIKNDSTAEKELRYTADPCLIV